MNGFVIRIAAVAAFGAASLAAHGQSLRPDDQIIGAFDAVVAAVAERMPEIERDVCVRFDLVDHYIGPQFDFRSASRLILGARQWPADEALQQRFIDAFYDSLVASYGELVIHFDHETLTFSRLSGEAESNPLWLDSVLRFTDGTTAKVRFQMYYDGSRWGIVDVRADSLAYSRDYRAQFWEHIYEHGFESLVTELEKMAAPRRRCSQ